MDGQKGHFYHIIYAVLNVFFFQNIHSVSCGEFIVKFFFTYEMSLFSELLVE